jgi:type IV secretory pathway protease TraF
MPKIVPAMHQMLAELVDANTEPAIYCLKLAKIITPESVITESNFSRIYRILAVGEGTEISLRNKIGDLVFLMNPTTSRVFYNSREWYIFPETAIIGRLEPLLTDEIVASVN